MPEDEKIAEIRKNSKADARVGGMVATAVLVFLGIFTVLLVYFSG